MAPQASSSAVPFPASFSDAQAKKAVDALLAHHVKVKSEKEDTELLPREEHVWLVINTKRGSTRRKLMPVKVQLPHPPLPPPPATAICLITKPPQRKYKDLLASPEHNIKFINRVVDTDKLKGKWKPFEARRNLARESDLFLCDEALVPTMPRLLGKIFFDAKKQPIPVNLLRKDLKAEFGRAIASTYFHPSTGTSLSIRIATASTTSPTHTLENLLSSITTCIALIEDGWDNILSLGIKTSASVLLPVWNTKLDGRFVVKPKFQKPKEGEDVSMEDGAAPEKKGKQEKKVKKREIAEKDKKEEEVEKADTAETDLAAPETAEEGMEKDEPKAKKVKATHSSALPSAAKQTTKADQKSTTVGSKKKSSTLGSGGASKKAKEGIIGRK